jgi:hypothetical protein
MIEDLDGRIITMGLTSRCRSEPLQGIVGAENGRGRDLLDLADLLDGPEGTRF